MLTEAFVRVLRSENSVTDVWFEQLILKKESLQASKVKTGYGFYISSSCRSFRQQMENKTEVFFRLGF